VVQSQYLKVSTGAEFCDAAGLQIPSIPTELTESHDLLTTAVSFEDSAMQFDPGLHEVGVRSRQVLRPNMYLQQHQSRAGYVVALCHGMLGPRVDRASAPQHLFGG
jgi:hypothetical protein